MITLTNVRELQQRFSVIKKQRITGNNNVNQYQLLEELNIQLSNGEFIKIKKGFMWDLSSVPRIFWSIFPPDGDFELASLIHDWLYINRKHRKTTRAFADKEMLIWSKATSGTNQFSFRNIDNYSRYYFVRLFGGLVWNDIIKI